MGHRWWQQKFDEGGI